MLRAFPKVFRHPAYTLLAFFVSSATFAFFVWLPNLRLLWGFALSSATFAEKFQFAISLLDSIQTNFTPLSAFLTVTVAILLGMYVAMFTYFLREQRTLSKKSLATGAGGVIGGLFGVGCSACGSFLIITIFGWAATSILIKFLPLKGAEFGIAGVLLLLVALYFIARRISRPPVCGSLIPEFYYL